METKTFQDNQNLIGFWDQAFSLSDDEREALRRIEPESWKEMAPSEKLFQAASGGSTVSWHGDNFCRSCQDIRGSEYP